MNTIREIQKLNKLELEKAVPPEASWHTDYRGTAYIHISGFPFTLTEGDLLTIFSQFGNPTYLHLARDKDSGKSRGFAWLKFEDQRSTDLAVDNLGGADVLGRVLKVDHAWYKRRDDETEEEARERELHDDDNGPENGEEDEDDRSGDGDERPQRPLLKEEVELAKLKNEHDDEDPMKEYLIREKTGEVVQAIAKYEKEQRRQEKKHKHRHKHRRRIEDADDQDNSREGRREKSRDKTSDSHRSSRREKDKRRHRRRSRSRSP